MEKSEKRLSFTFFTLTSLLKLRLRPDNKPRPDLVVVTSSTVPTVLKQGSRQSETSIPVKKGSKKGLIILNLNERFAVTTL